MKQDNQSKLKKRLFPTNELWISVSELVRISAIISTFLQECTILSDETIQPFRIEYRMVGIFVVECLVRTLTPTVYDTEYVIFIWCNYVITCTQ